MIDAIHDRDLKTIKELVELGIDLNDAARGKKMTFKHLPLECAISMAFPDVVKLLLELGADPYEKDIYGRNIFKIVKQYEDIAEFNVRGMSTLLISASVIDECNKRRSTMLRVREIIEILSDYKYKRAAEIQKVVENVFISDLANIIYGYVDGI